MRDHRIPDGWEFWTSEREFEDAWTLAALYKQTYEKVRADSFISVTVIRAAGVHWILTRKERERVS